MPVTISGLSSGMDTDGVVEKLLKVEAQPIRQLEIRKKEAATRRDALQQLRKFLDELNEAARELYGFRAAYLDKSIVVSDPAVMDVKADKLADKGTKRINVLQLANHHRIATDPVGVDEELPAAKFTVTVGGESRTIAFRGGKLKALRERIEEVAGEIVSVQTMNTTGDRQILTIESKTVGKKGEIRLAGDQGILTRIGLVDTNKGPRRDETPVVFKSSYLSPYQGAAGDQSGTAEVDREGRGVTITGPLWREYQLPAEVAVKADTTFEFHVTQKSAAGPCPDGGDEDVPDRIETGPDEKTVIRGIELRGYNIERIRQLDARGADQGGTMAGIGLVALEGGKRIEKIYPVTGSGPMTVNAGKDFAGKTVTRMVLYSNRGAASFADARFATPQKEQGGFSPKNEVAAAHDARLRVDGIEITRERNDNLTDIVKGLTITLKKPSRDDMTVAVDLDVNRSYEKIKKFVDAFNKYLDLHREMVKVAKADRPGDYQKSSYQKGLFVGDTTLARLEDILKLTVNAAYPNRAEKPIRLLTQIGVSTGAVNSNWEAIKTGKLIIDEAQVKKTIAENPEGVMYFFGSDSDGDNRVDNGMAFKVTNVLEPYVMTGKSIIASRIDLENSTIQSTDETIKRREEHLKVMERKLKEKFARMEETLGKSKAQQRWMGQQSEQMQQNSGGRGR